VTGKISSYIRVSAFAAAVLTLSPCMASAPPKVSTLQGKAEGKLINDGKVRAFLGLPYAAPPVGPLRWKAPQPPAAWNGVRDATKFGSRCQQWHIWNDYLFLDAGPSEDCLYLNVYAPLTANKQPVMFWIHGGGFLAGAGSEPRYTNSALPLEGVVLVTINYRLNVFGFLATDDLAKENGGAAGNYALMDMIAALGWVKANIARFGGDPDNVTIFGESAGSFAVSMLMAAPSARGLFHKAIGESGASFGGVLPTDPLAERARRDQAWTESLGAHSLANLRAMPADQLLEAAKQKQGGWAPVVDGRVLTGPVPETYAAGKQAHVPLMAGWNRDERTNTLSKGMTAEKWKAYAAEHYGGHAGDFLAAFPGITDVQAVRSADSFTTGAFIAFSAWKWIEAHAGTGASPVFRYRFDLASPPSEMHPEGRYAWHSAELEYVFGTLDARQGSQWRPEDRKLSGQMIRYWTDFARTGDPNGEGLPHWSRFDKEKLVLHLDRAITCEPDAERAQFEFLVKHPQEGR
jgi:para-nitrobenzyl esterase